MNKVLKKLGIDTSRPVDMTVPAEGLVQHFEEEILENDHRFFRFKLGDFNTFIKKLPEDYRLCYISDKKLHKLHEANKITKQQVLNEDILPDRGSIMSGDFGEIFCYLFTKEYYLHNGKQLKGLRKWRWKESRNKPAPGTDVLLFHMNDLNKACEDDFIVSIESKMKATPNARSNQVDNAISGAENDKTTRLVSSLQLLREQLSTQGRRQSESYKTIERFRHPDKTTTFKKEFRAIAIIDSTLFENETRELPDNNEIMVMAFSIPELKRLYQTVFEQILETVND